MSAGRKIDTVLLVSFLILVISGFFIFTSASLGLLTRGGNLFSEVAVKQGGIGILLGSLAFLLALKVDYGFWKKHAFAIAVGSFFLSLLVFVPHVGLLHGGAKRWILIGPLSFQPSEFLKLGLVVYFAAWLASKKEKITQFRYGLVPLTILIFLAAGAVLTEPDTGTFLVIVLGLLGMYIAAGARWRDILLLFLAAAVGMTVLFYTRPYIRDRMLTFVDPARDPLGSGYQIQQSLIAIGSGRVTGRGFGQSIQKFNYLPEPIGDSIFAVAGEEFGFIGSVILILFYVFFALRGLAIASKVNDSFGRLLIVGIVIMIIAQSFINIASMLGIMPITGIPLIFASQGGTALLLGIGEVGIVLNISRKRMV